MLKKLCWKYHVPDECYRASDWSALESGTAATLTVMSGGTTVSSTLQIKELERGLLFHPNHRTPHHRCAAAQQALSNTTQAKQSPRS